MRRRLAILGLALTLAGAGSGRADDRAAPDARRPAKRTRTTPVHDLFRGPFHSSRLFSMPAADVVGAYVLALSGEGSLLDHPGVLTSAGVLAIGFGDLAQLEYRHTAAISVTNLDAPVPAVGVQLQLPLPVRPNVPALAIAFRQGLARHEQLGATGIDETVTDFYVVARERLDAVPWLTLHAGLRVSPSTIRLSDGSASASRTLALPTGGIELAMNRTARIVGEVGLAPRFELPGATTPEVTRGVLARLGLRWSVVPWATLDASLGYQLDTGELATGGPRDLVQQWDIRLGAEVFVPWGALACRAVGAFCE